MRKGLTFEGAAGLRNFVQALERLPNHGDVNGNPVYKQFLRPTHIYEEDELHKRQDDLRALMARLGDDRLGSGFRPRLPPVPLFPPVAMDGQGELQRRGANSRQRRRRDFSPCLRARPA